MTNLKKFSVRFMRNDGYFCLLLMFVMAIAGCGNSDARWIHVYSDPDTGDSIYLERGAFDRQGDVATVTMLIDFKNNFAGRSSLVERANIDCNNKRTRAVSRKMFEGRMGNGRIVGEGLDEASSIFPPTSDGWSTMPPTRTRKMFMEHVCKAAS